MKSQRTFLTLILLVFPFLFSACRASEPAPAAPTPKSPAPAAETSEAETSEMTEEWIPLRYSEEELESYKSTLLLMSSLPSPEKAVHLLYLSPDTRKPAYEDPSAEPLSIRYEDEKNAFATISYSDGGREEIALTQGEDEFAPWIPVKYRILEPPLYEEKFSILSIREGELFYDEAEWVDSENEKRVRELRAQGVDDMGFENGYYIYNEKEEHLVLTLNPETQILMLSPDLEKYETQGEEELRRAIEQDFLSSYYRLYLKDGKAAKILQVYTP